MKNHLLFLFFLIFSFAFCQNRNQPAELKVKGDYIYPATKTILPELWLGFQRRLSFPITQPVPMLG